MTESGGASDCRYRSLAQACGADKPDEDPDKNGKKSMSYRIYTSNDHPDLHFAQAFEIHQSPPEAEAVFIRRASIGNAESGQDVINVIAEAFEFPDYFGGNLDALLDCLRDMDWRKAPSYVLILSDALPAWRRFPLDMGEISSVWLSAAIVWRLEGVGFKLGFEMSEGQ